MATRTIRQATKGPCARHFRRALGLCNLCEPTIRAMPCWQHTNFIVQQCLHNAIGKDAPIGFAQCQQKHQLRMPGDGWVGEIQMNSQDTIRSGLGLSQKWQRARSGKPQKACARATFEEHLGSVICVSQQLELCLVGSTQISSSNSVCTTRLGKTPPLASHKANRNISCTTTQDKTPLKF